MKNIKSWFGMSPSFFLKKNSNYTLHDKYVYFRHLFDIRLGNPTVAHHDALRKVQAATKRFNDYTCFEEFCLDMSIIGASEETEILCLVCYYYKFDWIVKLAKDMPKELNAWSKDKDFAKMVLLIDSHGYYVIKIS